MSCSCSRSPTLPGRTGRHHASRRALADAAGPQPRPLPQRFIATRRLAPLSIGKLRGDDCPGLDWALLAPIGKLETDHGRREIVVKANGGEIVTARPGFYVIAGHNPGVHDAVLT